MSKKLASGVLSSSEIWMKQFSQTRTGYSWPLRHKYILLHSSNVRLQVRQLCPEPHGRTSKNDVVLSKHDSTVKAVFDKCIKIWELQTALTWREITARERGEKAWPEGGGGEAHGAGVVADRFALAPNALVLRIRIQDTVIFRHMDPNPGSEIIRLDSV
jgi:hypothetical protein